MCNMVKRTPSTLVTNFILFFINHHQNHLKSLIIFVQMDQCLLALCLTEFLGYFGDVSVCFYAVLHLKVVWI